MNFLKCKYDVASLVGQLEYERRELMFQKSRATSYSLARLHHRHRQHPVSRGST